MHSEEVLLQLSVPILHSFASDNERTKSKSLMILCSTLAGNFRVQICEILYFLKSYSSEVLITVEDSRLSFFPYFSSVTESEKRMAKVLSTSSKQEARGLLCPRLNTLHPSCLAFVVSRFYCRAN